MSLLRRAVRHVLIASVGMAGVVTVPAVASAPAETPSAAPVVVAAGRHSLREKLTDAAGARTMRATAGLGAASARHAVLTDEISPGRFALAALTWPVGAVAPRDIQFRVREAGGWSAWLTVESDGVDDVAQQVRGGTEPFVTGAATAIQVRVGGDPAALPRDLELVVVPLDDVDVDATAAGATTGIGSGALARVGGGAGAAAPVRVAGFDAIATPDIITREEWGANPAYFDWEPTYAPLKAAVLHHTAGTNTYTAAQSISIVQAIYRYHAVDRGWGDIGYNFLVDKYGQMFEGRQGSVGSPPREMVIGGHAKPANTGTLGISAMGDYTTTSVPAAIYDAYVRVISWRFDLAGLDARGTSGIISPGSPTLAAGIDLPRIFAHRDVASTACPGDAIYAAMPALRDRVGAPSRTWGASSVSTAVYRWWSSAAGDWRGSPDDVAAATTGELTAEGYTRASAPQFYVSMDAAASGQVAIFRWWHAADKDWMDVPAGAATDDALIALGYSSKRFQYYAYSAAGTGRVAINRWWSAADRDWITLRQDEIPDATLQAWGYSGKTQLGYGRTSPQLATPVSRWWSPTSADWVGLADGGDPAPAGYTRSGTPQFYVSRTAGTGLVAVHRWWHPGDGDWVDVLDGTLTDAWLTGHGYTGKTFQYYLYGSPAAGRVAVNRWWSAADRDWITLRQDEVVDATLGAWGYTGKTVIGYAVAGPES